MTTHRVFIEALDNGYVIEYTVDSLTKWRGVARSWVEVLELLKESGAPDFEGVDELIDNP